MRGLEMSAKMLSDLEQFLITDERPFDDFHDDNEMLKDLTTWLEGSPYRLGILLNAAHAWGRWSDMAERQAELDEERDKINYEIETIRKNLSQTA